MMKNLSASILGQKDPVKLVNKLISKGIVQIHYDVMDGTFINRHSLAIKEVSEIVQKSNPHIVDVHLMVNNPEQNILIYKKVANFLTIHYETESKDKLMKILEKYKKLKIGIALNPSTPIRKIFPFLNKVSHILIMSVVPGKGGQSFIKKTLKKIKKLKKQIVKKNLKIDIQVDGGINNIYGPLSMKAGASSLVSGTFLVNNIEEKEIINKIAPQN